MTNQAEVVADPCDDQDVSIRAARVEDVDDCGRICYPAFAHIADRHRFPHDFPSAAATAEACGSSTTNAAFPLAAVGTRVIMTGRTEERGTSVAVAAKIGNGGEPARFVGAHLNSHMDRQRLEPEAGPADIPLQRR